MLWLVAAGGQFFFCKHSGKSWEECASILCNIVHSQIERAYVQPQMAFLKQLFPEHNTK